MQYYTGKLGAIDVLLALLEKTYGIIGISKDELVDKIQVERNRLLNEMSDGMYIVDSEADEFVKLVN